MKRVLINAPLAASDVRRLRAEAEVVGIDEGEISQRIENYIPFEGMIASAVISLDGTLMDRLSQLQVVGRLGTGVDNVDLEAATQRGIVVVHTPGAPTQSTAEHAVALLYSLVKDMVFQDQQLKNGNWDVRHEHIGRELSAMTMGFVGLGRIGRRVAEILRPLQLRMLAFDPYVESDVPAQVGVELVESLDELLPIVDIVSIHVPLSDETHKLIGREALARMKPRAVLINTARGGVVDEQALIEALRSGSIAGAALDVFDPEPPEANNPLFSMENVVLTPHRAFYTQEGLARLSKVVVDQTLKALRGEHPDYIANPGVWSHALCRRQ
ncbi:MAG: hydroxyacid dehydrogenase [Anaerolineales bacterium]